MGVAAERPSGVEELGEIPARCIPGAVLVPGCWGGGDSPTQIKTLCEHWGSETLNGSLQPWLGAGTARVACDPEVLEYVGMLVEEGKEQDGTLRC